MSAVALLSRYCTRFLVAALVLLVAPASALAARNVTFASTFSPISRLGEGTSYTTELTLSGSEYHGQVDPLTGLTVHLPAGVGVSDAGFPTCSKTTIEQFTPAGCPAGSLAGPVSSLKLVLYFGTEAIEEEATVQAVFGPAGVLYFFMEGGPPVQIETIMEGHYVSDSSPYGQDLVLTVPTIETVPGAPDASITALTLNVGQLVKKAAWYSTASACQAPAPRGNLPGRAMPPSMVQPVNLLGRQKRLVQQQAVGRRPLQPSPSQMLLRCGVKP